MKAIYIILRNKTYGGCMVREYLDFSGLGWNCYYDLCVLQFSYDIRLVRFSYRGTEVIRNSD
jgi:hypothetical protein